MHCTYTVATLLSDNGIMCARGQDYCVWMKSRPNTPCCRLYQSILVLICVPHYSRRYRMGCIPAIAATHTPTMCSSVPCESMRYLYLMTAPLLVTMNHTIAQPPIDKNRICQTTMEGLTIMALDLSRLSDAVSVPVTALHNMV